MCFIRRNSSERSLDSAASWTRGLLSNVKRPKARTVMLAVSALVVAAMITLSVLHATRFRTEGVLIARNVSFGVTGALLGTALCTNRVYQWKRQKDEVQLTFRNHMLLC